ncbi:hypothetical protein SAMN05421835_13529 [Amycolatopsis sacchari]|uniref:Uncharacterized protein n=1 Tax=Amycolatopsis sacchari TaxID=115433 RepID=A0A1I4CLJ6_9PSEU|nr:hypothetical protein [Amycolatopsis sacchari]SFK81099.1 hypothetical protein SAMN05421835_13529 [Amycolatopsis sacchari]
MIAIASGSELEQHLVDLHAGAEKAIRASVSDHSSALGRLLQLDLDIKAWEECLRQRPETALLTSARRNLAYAIYCAASGLYSQAYASVRLFLELSFAAVYFSAHELDRRRWVAGRYDFSWSKALDEQDGVLATRFVREFNEDAGRHASIFAEKAAVSYRSCSEYVHGKATHVAALPDSLSFSGSVLTSWSEISIQAAESVLYLLLCRYGGELLPSDDGKLEQGLEAHFSHLKYVRSFLGLPVDDEG